MQPLPHSNQEERLFRAPTLADGKAMHRLAEAAGTLDVNSGYAYLLPALHHADASVLAEIDGGPAGFVSGYRLPGATDTAGGRLFVWQVGVHPYHRGQGLARDMLLELVSRPQNRAVRFIETTISPSNNASQKLFAAVARTLHARMEKINTLDAALFPSAHEEEIVYRIGPFNPESLIQEGKYA